MGHEVVAITEHDTISSHIRAEKYYKKIKEKNPNFKLILGNEIYLVRNGLTANNFNKDYDRYYHCILWAKDKIGHQQIREISTRAWMRSYTARRMRRVPTYYQDLIDIIGANPGHVIGSTACFRAGTQVETKQGWKNIEDIQKGDFVINRYGEWEEVLEPTSMMTHQYGYVIDVVGNDRPITCTDNHQFLVISNNVKTPKWVQAKDLILKSGGTKHIGLEPINCQYSQSPVIKKEEWNDSYFKETKLSRRKYHLPEEIVITPEIMRMFGLFLGDGCITLKKRPRIYFTFNEKEYDNYMNSFMYKAGEQLGITWNVSRRPQSHRVDISSDSVELINLFYSLFGDVKANTKRVPARLRISKNLDYELVFGYFLADGYFRSRLNSGKASGYITGEFVSASISKYLSYDIYNILNQLGISSSVSFSRGRIDNSGVTHQDSWYVHGSNKFLGAIDKLKSYSHTDVIRIFKEAIEYKKKDFIEIDGIKYRRIRFKSKKQIKMHERVYCLNNTTHSFKCENLIVHNCLGGCLPTQLLRNKMTGAPEMDKIKIWINQMINIFGKEDFYFEMQPSHNKEQIYVNNELIKLSEDLGIKFIITNDAHYLKKEDRLIHKAFLNSQQGDREVDDFYATTYLMSDNEIKEFMEEEIGEENLLKAYSNIIEIKNKCQDYILLKPLKIPRLDWKTFNVNEEEKIEWKEKIPYIDRFMSSTYSEDRHLAYAIIDRVKNDATLQDEKTLKEIGACLEDTWISSEVNGSRWSAYFLNLQNIIDTCWDAGTLVGAGRGSGVGFILLYLLGITQINPLRENSPTRRWRFLNPQRVSVLDVDIDIEGGKRATVLKAFRNIYGEDRVANVLTLKTEKSKSAILTAARGLGIDVDTAQYLSSFIEADRGQLRTLRQTFYGDPENRIKASKQFRIEMTENYPELWEVAQGIEGLINGCGVHAGGVIFVDEPFTNSSALMRAPNGEIITQFDLHDAEATG